MKFSVKFLRNLPAYENIQPYKIHDHPDLPLDQQTNCEFEIRDIDAQDLRSESQSCTLENEGFLFVKRPTHCSLNAKVFEASDAQSNKIVEEYIMETMSFVKEKFNASSAIAIDWRFRRNQAAEAASHVTDGDIRKQAISIATEVHCDFSTDGGHERVRMHLTQSEWEALESTAANILIVNVWRPLNVVYNAPLLLADRRTIKKSDFIETDQVGLEKVTKTALMFHQEYHQWYWLSHQQPQEVIVFPTWKMSSDETIADCSAHVAASLHNPDPSMPPRESVEVRFIVFT